MPNPPPSPSPQELEQAFSLFNAASAQLAAVYQDLREQVARLSAELAVANGELRQQYEEKEALSRRLGLLLEALPGGVVVLDAAGRVSEANPAALHTLGPDILRKAWSEVEASRLGPDGPPGEWQVSGADGAPLERWVSICASPLDPAGARILLLSDITEARRLHEQLERHQRLSAMGEMAAGLAHQLRTPLATALLYAGNLARPQLSQLDRLRFAERAQARLRELERMIQDMLTFVRGAPSAQESIGVEDLVQELAQVMEPQMQAQGVHFAAHSECPGARLRGNRKALAGALVNLLDNALQACTLHGEVRLDAVTRRGAVELRVSDSGAGIAPELQARLFEPFFTTRSEGTGLGLAIARSVVQAHGGELAVQSEPGRGSVFTVRLPGTDGDDAQERR